MLIESQPSVLGCPAPYACVASCQVVPEETKRLNVCKDTAGDDTWDDIPLVANCPHVEVGLILVMLVGD